MSAHPTRRRYTDAEKRRVLELVARGTSYSAAARQVGIKHSTAILWCRAAGVTSHDTAPPALEDDGWTPAQWVHPYRKRA